MLLRFLIISHVGQIKTEQYLIILNSSQSFFAYLLDNQITLVISSTVDVLQINLVITRNDYNC